MLSDLVDFGEDPATLLGEEETQPLLAALDVLPWEGTMNGSPPPAKMPSNGILSPGSDGVGASTMLKSGGDRVFHLVLEPGPTGVNDALPCRHSFWGWIWFQPLPALEEVAALGQLVKRLEDLGHRRGLPCVRFPILDVAIIACGSLFPEHLVEDELAGVLQVDPSSPTAPHRALDLLGEGQHLIPGLRGTRSPLPP